MVEMTFVAHGHPMDPEFKDSACEPNAYMPIVWFPGDGITDKSPPADLDTIRFDVPMLGTADTCQEEGPSWEISLTDLISDIIFLHEDRDGRGFLEGELASNLNGLVAVLRREADRLAAFVANAETETEEEYSRHSRERDAIEHSLGSTPPTER